jgi:hypothetical protein
MSHRISAGAPRVLRGVVILVLAVLLVLSPTLLHPGGEDGAPESGLRTPPPLYLTSLELEEADGWDRALRHGAEAPLVALVPGDPPVLLAEPPGRLRAGRPAPLRVQATVPARVTLSGEEAREEKRELTEGESYAFLLRPREEGWRSWTLRTTGIGEPTAAGAPQGWERSHAWTGWAEAYRPLHVLVMSGPPSQESRMVVRALEEAGERVETWIHLGRDRWIGRGGGPLPTDPEAYAPYDAVFVLPGLELPPGAAAGLLRAAAEGGMGLVLAATTGGSSALAGRVLHGREPGDRNGSRRVRGEELRWVLPPEVPPLPSSPVEVTLPGSLDPAAFVGVGRGRAAFVALTDTWRWRMEAGEVDGHRAFWQGMANWASAGLVGDPVVELLAGDLLPGELVRVRVTGHPDFDGLRMRGPDGTERPLPMGPPGDTPAGEVRLGAFVASEEGGYRLFDPRGDGEEPGRDHAAGVGGGTAVQVQGTASPGMDPDGRLARVALASPGGRVEVLTEPAGAAAEGRRGEARTGRQGLPGGDGTRPGGAPLRLLLFLLLAGALVGEWSLRRGQGRT